MTGQDALKEIKNESYLTLFSRHKFSFSFIFSLLSCLLLFRLLSSPLCLSLLALSSLCLSLLALSQSSCCVSLCLSMSPCDVVCGSAHVVSVVVSVVCRCGYGCGRGVCACVVYTLENSVCPFNTSSCVRLRRRRVCRHHANMCFNMCAWCWYTRRRFERTHGDVWNRQFCLPEFAHL